MNYDKEYTDFELIFKDVYNFFGKTKEKIKISRADSISYGAGRTILFISNNKKYMIDLSYHNINTFLKLSDLLNCANLTLNQMIPLMENIINKQLLLFI